MKMALKIGGVTVVSNSRVLENITSYTGDFTATGNITAYSDARLKTNLKQIENALEKVKQLTGYVYKRLDTNTIETGLIAQDVEKVLPEAVNKNNEYLAVAYGNLIGLIVEAIKELELRLKEVEGR